MNLMSAIPLVGQEVVTWLWAVGGNPTLKPIFLTHYLLPFVIVGVVSASLALYTTKSNNLWGIDLMSP